MAFVFFAGKLTHCGDSACAVPKLPNFKDRFVELLTMTHMTRPKPEILDVISRRLSAQMIVCHTPDMAADLYEEAQLLPGASTVSHLFTQHGLRVNGPLYPRYRSEMHSLASPSSLSPVASTGCESQLLVAVQARRGTIMPFESCG